MFFTQTHAKMGFKFPDLESGRTVKLIDVVFCKEDARFFAQVGVLV